MKPHQFQPKYADDVVSKAVALSIRIGTTAAAKHSGIPIGTIKAWRRKSGVQYHSNADAVIDRLRRLGPQTTRQLANGIGLPVNQCANLLWRMLNRSLLTVERPSGLRRYSLPVQADGNTVDTSTYPKLSA